MVDEIGVDSSRTKIKLTDASRSWGNKRVNYRTEGVFREANGGFGFVRSEDEERDIFIPESSVGDAIDGDIVAVSYKKFLSDSGEERTEGRITEILEYGKSTVIGTVESDVIRIHKRRALALYILPDDGKIKRRIFLRDTAGAEVGDKVSAKLIRDPYSFTLYADVLKVFGDSASKDANYMAILEENEIETDFTKEELEAARIAAAEPVSTEGRVDLTGKIIFTIDSESAKDLDDAISLDTDDEGNSVLGVHIADVSHYVKEKTELDRLAMRRGTSVYFTDKVVPMLPTDLSNGSCSLNPGEPKYALSAIITIDKSGEILNTRIEKTVIVSRIKGIYSEINRIFEGNAGESLTEKYKELIPTLLKMHKLYKILAKKSDERGTIELESAESQIILDKNGTPTDVIRCERGDAEKLIEQFMLAANEGVATLLLSEEIPCVFRVHEPPSEEKLSDFLSYASNLGLNVRGISSSKCNPADIAAIMRQAAERGIGEAVSYACLRSMTKAYYSEIRIPHFGLGIENYCHFTSPIRRLSDLATHRIIHKTLFEGKPKEKYRGYAKRAAAAASDGEQRALAAERRIEGLYKVIYMSEHIGEIYPAKISSITSFGIFATLENTCEGLIPISEMEGSFVYDEKNITMRNNKTALHIGDEIMIRVEEADMIRGKLRFAMVTGDEE